MPSYCIISHCSNLLKFMLSILLLMNISSCHSFAQSRLTLCTPMDCSTPGSSVLQCLPEFVQIHVQSNRWCCLTISSSAASFSYCLQSFPISGSFSMSWLFISSDQSIFLDTVNITTMSSYLGSIPRIGLTQTWDRCAFNLKESTQQFPVWLTFRHSHQPRVSSHCSPLCQCLVFSHYSLWPFR